MGKDYLARKDGRVAGRVGLFAGCWGGASWFLWLCGPGACCEMLDGGRVPGGGDWSGAQDGGRGWSLQMYLTGLSDQETSSVL